MEVVKRNLVLTVTLASWSEALRQDLQVVPAPGDNKGYRVRTATGMNYDGRTFRSVRNSGTGEVDGDTLFRYHERDGIVWAEYEGGAVVRGHLLATKSADGSLEMRYQHVNRAGQLMTGLCRTRPEVLADGRLRLHERWQWTCGDGSSGESLVEEVRG